MIVCHNFQTRHIHIISGFYELRHNWMTDLTLRSTPRRVCSQHAAPIDIAFDHSANSQNDVFIAAPLKHYVHHRYHRHNIQSCWKLNKYCVLYTFPFGQQQLAMRDEWTQKLLCILRRGNACVCLCMRWIGSNSLKNIDCGANLDIAVSTRVDSQRRCVDDRRIIEPHPHGTIHSDPESSPSPKSPVSSLQSPIRRGIGHQVRNRLSGSRLLNRYMIQKRVRNRAAQPRSDRRFSLNVSIKTQRKYAQPDKSSRSTDGRGANKLAVEIRIDARQVEIRRNGA
jgi:hypothetical protein